MLAATEGFIDIVRDLLVQRGIDITCKDKIQQKKNFFKQHFFFFIYGILK